MKHKLLTNNYKLFGAISGDVIGSSYEFMGNKVYDFNLFTPGMDCTDDTILTIAVAEKLLENSDYSTEYRKYGRNYPNPKGGYGNSFRNWLTEPDGIHLASYGNGSAMRISPVGFAFNTLEETLYEAKKCAEISHGHPEGIKGAQAVAQSIFMARKGKSKDEIREAISSGFGYNLSRTCNEIRPKYTFNETCQDTVPESIISFLESNDFEDAIRLTISLGGDADTMGAITGAIAEAFYGEVPLFIKERVIDLLPEDFLRVIVKFNEKYSG